jgi:hypothetical protein
LNVCFGRAIGFARAFLRDVFLARACRFAGVFVMG